jgi:hypothetical protein
MVLTVVKITAICISMELAETVERLDGYPFTVANRNVLDAESAQPTQS